MAGAIGLGIVLIAMAVLVVNNGEASIAGVAPHEFASAAALTAVAILVAGSLAAGFRGHWAAGLRALLAWLLVFAGLGAAYQHRGEIRVLADQMIAEVSPGRPVVGAGGEVVIARRVDGSFTVAATVNQRDQRFVFDTGASMVVLTAESAAAAGLRPASLAYTVPVATANGRAMAALATLDRLAVGPIAERQVRALVARPGALHQNLLGMSFLERLASYEVRGNRLILRGKTTAASQEAARPDRRRR
jgi:aspartyl protease family protein